ncbi:protease SohB [Desulfonema ishimotonii]|uniref:Protease SohB n=1 Tax=Desulfonema ishimotonii TaxID=45657 RepID=A0A401G0P0_9BACT|nr:protease SohB [Desulfonema ishimotonii]GBC62780.1 protease SohB [Desulfonema ishimotonii]
MKDFMGNYSLFLAKALTIALTVSVVLAIGVAILESDNDSSAGYISVKKLNDRYEAITLEMKKHLLSADEYEKAAAVADAAKEAAEGEKAGRKRVFVLSFSGDLAASAVAGLREEISAVLGVATPEDEVIVRLESGGGMVHSYGLAASQLQRIRDRNIPLTIAVDKIAASGGYMMACVGDRLVAAPFAIIGSVGVIFSTPNFHRFLQKHDIDYEQITAGEYKRTLTLFGQITEKGRDKTIAQVQAVHDLFKQFIAAHRKSVDMEKVATGEFWYASQALNLKLVDELMTSDDLLRARSRTADLYEVTWQPNQTLSQQLSASVRLMVSDLFMGLWQLAAESRYQ